MVQTPTNPENQTLPIELPSSIRLYISQEQFTAESGCKLRLETGKTAQGELIVNLPTLWETGMK